MPTKRKPARKSRSKKARKTPTPEEMAEKFVTMMETEDVPPWVHGWKKLGIPFPTNHSTGKRYRGSNVFFLSLYRYQAGYQHNLWMTFKQASEMAVKQARADGVKVERREGKRGPYYVDAATNELIKGVKKGAVNWPITFWKFEKVHDRDPVTHERRYDDDGKPKMVRIGWVKTYLVYNIEDTYVRPPEAGVELTEPERHAMADQTIEDTGAVIEWEGDRACFIPSRDVIKMPPRDQWETAEALYNIAFHELGHWTGHKSRLDRNLKGMFGDEAYAMEELIAEMTASLVCAEHQIDATLRHASYMEHWIGVLKADPKVLFAVAAKAQKAADLIMGRPTEYEESNDSSEKGSQAADTAQEAA